MNFELYREYCKTFNSELLELKYGFAQYRINEFDEGNCRHVIDLFASSKDRGFNNGKSTSRRLFEKLKDIAIKEKCNAITAEVWADSYRGSDVIKLYLYLGFKIISGNGAEIKLTYFMDNEE